MNQNSCCGDNGCGEVYRNEIVEMLDTLKVVKESNVLSKSELDQLFRAVITYDNTKYEVK